MIVGIDEVGRGCLAGPVCVAAVALVDYPVGLDDSKLLSRERRRTLAQKIRQTASMIGIGWASAQVIDRYGMTAALRQAAQGALQPFGNLPELILLDGNHNYLNDPRVVTMIDGDYNVPLISAASIVAKVARDNYMQLLAQRFPQYSFEQHVGYSTAMHRAALATFGPCAVHRLSFAPFKQSVLSPSAP